MTKELYLTNSSIQSYLDCKREHWLSQVRGLYVPTQEVSRARDVGSIVHATLEYYYRFSLEDGRWPSQEETLQYFDGLMMEERAKFQVGEQMAASIQELDHNLHQLKELDWVEEWSRIMLEGYFQWIEEEGHDANLEVIEPEKEIVVPFFSYGGYDIYLAGKIDVLVFDRFTETRKFLETKTTGDLSYFAKMGHMLPQVMHYCLLDFLDAGEQRTDGALLNLIRRVKRTSRAKPPFYQRYPVHINRAQIESYNKRLIGIAKNMVDDLTKLEIGADHRMIAYPTVTKNCTWKCPFFNVCPMFDDTNADAEAYVDMAYAVGDPLWRYRSLRDESAVSIEDISGLQ